MEPRYILLLSFVGVAILCIYITMGVESKAVTHDYNFHGWIFAPARWLRRFLCGMFIGHEYDNNGVCKHCFKKKREKQPKEIVVQSLDAAQQRRKS